MSPVQITDPGKLVNFDDHLTIPANFVRYIERINNSDGSAWGVRIVDIFGIEFKTPRVTYQHAIDLWAKGKGQRLT